MNRIEKFGKAVLKMQQEMRSRDEALKKVPSNCAQLLKDLKKQMEATTERCDDVERKFEGTVDVGTFEAKMKDKLEAAHFHKVFPASRSP